MHLFHLSAAAFAASAHCQALRPSPPRHFETTRVGGQTQSICILKGFVSFSIEFAFFPDFAGRILELVSEGAIETEVMQAISLTQILSLTIFWKTLEH